MAKRKLTYEEIYNLKFEELKRLMPYEAHPYLERMRPDLRAIDEKYAPLYAQAGAHHEPPEADSSFLKIHTSTPLKSSLTLM